MLNRNVVNSSDDDSLPSLDHPSFITATAESTGISAYYIMNCFNHDNINTDYSNISLLSAYLSNHKNKKYPSLSLPEVLAVSPQERINLYTVYNFIEYNLLTIDASKALTENERMILVCEPHNTLKECQNALAKLNSHRIHHRPSEVMFVQAFSRAITTSSRLSACSSSMVVSPISVFSPAKDALGEVDDKYHIAIHKDYSPELKDYLAWLNMGIKKRNSILVSKKARDMIEDNEKYKEEFCCQLSFTVPEVPVSLPDERLYCLLELEKYLTANNGEAKLPFSNDQTRTFTRKDILRNKNTQIKLTNLIIDLNKQCVVRMPYEALEALKP